MVYYSVNNTGILRKRKSECPYQESNLRPSNYQFGCSTTELLMGAKAIGNGNGYTGCSATELLMGAKAIKLSSWDRHPVYCYTVHVGLDCQCVA